MVKVIGEGVECLITLVVDRASFYFGEIANWGRRWDDEDEKVKKGGRTIQSSLAGCFLLFGSK